MFNNTNPDILVPHDSRIIQNDLTVTYSIHLIKPVDNQQSRTLKADPPESLHLSSAKVFEWEPVPAAKFYRVSFKGDEYISAEVNITKYSPELKMISENGHFEFYVGAYNKDGVLIGSFQNYYRDGYGGTLKFDVVPDNSPIPVPPMVLAFRSNRISHVFAVDNLYLYDTAMQNYLTLSGAGNPKIANNVDISADAQYVAWDDGKSILLYDRIADKMVPLPNCAPGVWPTLSQHAEYIAFIGGSSCYDGYIAVYDRLGAKMLSLSSQVSQHNEHWPCIDPSGRFIAFNREINGQSDVFLYDRQAQSLVPLPGANDPQRDERWPQVDYGAQTISFWREGSGNSANPPVPGEIMVYLRGPNMFAPTKLLSLMPNKYAWGYEHSMSSNGRFLLVSYSELNPAATPPNHIHPDLYVYDRQNDMLLSLQNLNTVWWEWKPSVSG